MTLADRDARRERLEKLQHALFEEGMPYSQVREEALKILLLAEEIAVILKPRVPNGEGI